MSSAALEALGEVGYTAMTFAEVAKRAGVSRGAILHYYPTKSDLALAAIEYAESEAIRALRELVEDATSRPDADERIIDALYEIHSGSGFQAFLSFQLHARTDPPLNARLHAIVEHATRAYGAIAAQGWGPEVEQAEGFQPLLQVILGTVRGLVSVAAVAAPSNPDVWPAARGILAAAIQDLRGGTAPG
jgi:AcrR family transcriptional regulator